MIIAPIIHDTILKAVINKIQTKIYCSGFGRIEQSSSLISCKVCQPLPAKPYTLSG